MSKTALVIIDVQDAMFSYDKIYPFHGNQVLCKIKLLLDKARESGIPVVYVQHTSTDEYEKGTPTWQICSEIQPMEGEPIVEKPTWDSFHKTDLQDILHQLGITKLIIAGMQTEFCVDTTCRRAFSMGYETTLVEDAHTTFDNEILTADLIIRHHNRVLGNRFVQLKTTEEILQSNFEL
jgi:nicotinamidase-related amidase